MNSEIKYNKKPNPRKNANIFSALTFWWMIPIFYKGFKKDFEISDLFETLEEHRSDTLGNKIEASWDKELERCKNLNKQPNLLRVLIKVFGVATMFYGLFAGFLHIATVIIEPYALGKLVHYYSTKPEERDINDAYIYTGILILSNFIIEFNFQQCIMACFHLSMKIKISICSLMYRKVLRLNKNAFHNITSGQIVNLMSNDVKRLDELIFDVHDLWIGPICTIIATIIMYQEIGISAVIGTMYIVGYVPFQSWLALKKSVLRLKTALRTDERLRLMNEIINGIQVIKMYTWEIPFAAFVAQIRRREIKQIRYLSYIRGINLSLMLFTTRTAIFLVILSRFLFGNEITASQIFIVTATLNFLRHSMTDAFPFAIGQIAEASVSLKRINKFLISNELTNPEVNTIKDGSILIKNVSAKWNCELTDNTLSNINLSVEPGKLVTIIGPVGSGKTSLLHTILKELPLSDGIIDVNGDVSYASQEPWLFAGSVRQNILFGEEMDKVRYQKVVHCCALLPDFQSFPYGDKTLVGERGISLSGGQKARINLARAVYKKTDIYLLDDPLSAVDTHVGKQLFDTCIDGMLKDKTVILITHQLQYLKEVDQIIILKNGVKEAEGSYSQLQQSGLDFAKLLDEQTQEDEQIEKPGLGLRQNSTQSETEEPEEVKEHKSIGHVAGQVYRTYLKSTGNGCMIFIVVMFFVLSQFFASASDYFVSYWVNLEESHNKTESDLNRTNREFDDDSFWNFSRQTCIYIYLGIILLTIVTTLCRSFIFFNGCMKASIKLHDNMFSSVTRATMRFFHTNRSGRIINRFSKDIGNIDEQLPRALMMVVECGFSLLGITIIFGVINPWLLLPLVVISIFFYFLGVIYLSTSRSIKRLEGITNSPIYGHVVESLQGLSTIRAFKTQELLQNEFDHHQDLHSTTSYIFLSASRSFSMWLDFVCIIFLFAVTLSFFLMESEQNGGNVGLAITQAMNMLGLIHWSIRQVAELENQMTSVERVDEYTKVAHERLLESATNIKPPQNWPQEGQIEFHNIYLHYNPSDPPVLQNLCFTVKPREKIGIVGRTGAGKSSLIAALFQLTETTGCIIIDGINIIELGLHDIRSKISIIPQEPVLFSGTMRKNLDPFDEYADDILWKALEEVQLKQIVADLPAGLNSEMTEGGSNFSVGQRQLVCLARAIVRNNQILVLDEATANVDPQTDALIQQTIRSKFENCTVLTIAHRLHTVMDSDKVLVMEAGRIVEFDQPHVLLEKQNGFLYKMVEQTGHAMAEALKHVATKTYRSNDQKKYL